MFNKIQKNRKRIGALLALGSLAIILPMILTFMIEIVLIGLWILLIVLLLTAAVMFFSGIVLTVKWLTYLGCMFLVIIVGVILYFTVDFPDFVEDSSMISILVVVLNLFLTQGLRLPAVAGTWVTEKLDPSLRPRRSGHGTDVPAKPYSYLFGNRVEHISSGKPYALESSRGFLRALRIGLWFLLTIGGFIGLFVVIEVTSFGETFGEFGVYVGIYVCFASIVLAFVLLLAGFLRLFVGIILSVLTFGLLYFSVIGLIALHSQSLLLFGFAIMMGIGLVVLIFYRMFRIIEISMGRNLTLYDHEGKTIAFDLVASHYLPLENFTHVALMTFVMPSSKIPQRILKLTDSIRFYANHRRILMAGYQSDPTAKTLTIYFYAENAEVLKKLSAHVARWIKKPIQVTLDHDPDNALFTRDLVPDMNRLIEIMNYAELTRLQAHRFNFDRTFRIVFYVKFETKDPLEDFKQVAEEMGYGSVTLYPDNNAAAITKDVVLSLDFMNNTCKKTHQLAQSYNGSFNGWTFEDDR